LDRLRVGVGPQRHERKLEGLVVHRLRDLLATVPDLNGEQAGEAVDVLPALVIEDVVALAAYDDRRLTTVEQCLVWAHVQPHVTPDGLLIRRTSPGDILRYPVPQ